MWNSALPNDKSNMTLSEVLQPGMLSDQKVISFDKFVKKSSNFVQH